MTHCPASHWGHLVPYTSDAANTLALRPWADSMGPAPARVDWWWALLRGPRGQIYIPVNSFQPQSTILYIISLQWACLPLCKTTIKVYTAHSITGALTEMVFSRGPGRRKLLYTWPAGREPLGCSTQEEPQEADMAPIACHSTCATGCQDMHVCAHVCSKWPGVRSVAGLSCTVSKQMNE